MTRLLPTLPLLLLAGCLSGCGQMGPLYPAPAEPAHSGAPPPKDQATAAQGAASDVQSRSTESQP